jgi:hypothetical protein
VVTAESLLKSLASITLEAQGNLATNPNADPLGLVLLDGCEDAVDKDSYPDDSNDQSHRRRYIHQALIQGNAS